MSFEYIRRCYGVPARRGGRIEWTTKSGTKSGTITGATHYLNVRFDGTNHSVPIHPKEEGLRYLDDTSNAFHTPAVAHV